MQQGTIRAIEAGAGLVGVGVLEYVSTSTDARQWLEQLVPAQLVPLVAIVLGGIAITVRAYRATGPSVASPTLDEPAPTSSLATSAPAPAPAAPAATPPAASAATEAAGLADSATAAATDATDGATPAAAPGPQQDAVRPAPALPVLPALRDEHAMLAYARSLGITEPAPEPEPAAPPTSFIPLPTR